MEEIKKQLFNVNTKLDYVFDSLSKKTNVGSLHLQTISKVENSSKLVRAILVSLVLACIILFTGFWNSLSFSWLQSRIKMHEYQLYWIDNIKNETTPDNLTKEEVALFSKCKDYYYSKHYTEEILTNELENLKNANINYSTLIKVPLLNITFDVNDLGLIGGFFLTIIYFLLAYSLINRYNQLDNVFYLINSIKKKEEKKSAYIMVLMDQILTLPRQGIKHYKFIRLTPRILYFIPLIVLASIFVNDVCTFENGSYYLNSIGKSIILYAASVLFFVISTVFAFFCLHLVKKTDELWNENYPKKQFPNK